MSTTRIDTTLYRVNDEQRQQFGDRFAAIMDFVLRWEPASVELAGSPLSFFGIVKYRQGELFTAMIDMPVDQRLSVAVGFHHLNAWTLSLKLTPFVLMQEFAFDTMLVLGFQATQDIIEQDGLLSASILSRLRQLYKLGAPHDSRPAFYSAVGRTLALFDYLLGL